MGANGLDEYWVPEHVKEYLRKLGFVLPLDDMELSPEFCERVLELIANPDRP